MCDSFSLVASSVEPKNFLPATQWPTIQENGQRMYGPPSWWIGPPPPKGTEVYMKKIPRKCSEQELCSILSRVGLIYNLRLMMDFSGTNRGFAFAQFSTREEAQRAIKELNNYPIAPGESIILEESKNNCRLFIGRIPKHLDDATLRKTLSNHLPRIHSVFLYMAASHRVENRGFCFVEFEDHRSAAMSRRELLSKGIPEWGTIELTVDWAVPENEIPPGLLAKLTTVYIRNLSEDTTEEDIRKFLQGANINLSFITKVKIVKDFAFVHLANRSVAEYALSRLNGVILKGARLCATWAKPPPKHSDDSSGEASSVESVRSRRSARSSTKRNTSFQRNSAQNKGTTPGVRALEWKPEACGPSTSSSSGDSSPDTGFVAPGGPPKYRGQLLKLLKPDGVWGLSNYSAPGTIGDPSTKTGISALKETPLIRASSSEVQENTLEEAGSSSLGIIGYSSPDIGCMAPGGSQQHGYYAAQSVAPGCFSASPRNAALGYSSPGIGCMAPGGSQQRGYYAAQSVTPGCSLAPPRNASLVVGDASPDTGLNSLTNGFGGKSRLDAFLRLVTDNMNPCGLSSERNSVTAPRDVNATERRSLHYGPQFMNLEPANSSGDYAEYLNSFDYDLDFMGIGQGSRVYGALNPQNSQQTGEPEDDMEVFICKMLQAFPNNTYIALNRFARHFDLGPLHHIDTRHDNGWTVTITLQPDLDEDPISLYTTQIPLPTVAEAVEEASKLILIGNRLGGRSPARQL